MDSSEFPNIILSRVQKLEPENFFKIVGCIFLMGHGEQEMIQLAFAPDNVLLSKINEAKSLLSFLSPKSALVSAQVQSPPCQLNPFTRSPTNFHVPVPVLEAPTQSLDFVPRPFNDSFVEDYTFHNQPHFLGMEDPSNSIDSFYCHEATMGSGLPPRVSRRTMSLPEILKPCIYHYKGNCKHGASCKFFHGQLMHGDYVHMFNPNMNEWTNEDDGFLPGSLDKLEMEITEILRSRGGSPVSIASLPMLYSEKYGRSLQAEGYLTESQRHGKTGYSLTKLLTRLKNSILVIDRPHGQHSVILAEDAPRFMECRSERNESGVAAASSHQIYLTFPADSDFKENDVGKYFLKFGQVEDVRIPCQDKRMFGFVSFTNSETVKAILSRRNPHYICGARVLVKPYKEKSKMFDRTYMEKMRPLMYHHPSHYFEMDPEIHSVYSIPREFDGSRLVRKCSIDENQKMMELERMRPSDFNLGPKPLNQQPYLNYCVEELKTPPGLDEFPLVDHFSYTLDALNIGSTSDDKTRNTIDQESVQVDLPESPFASPQISNSVSTVKIEAVEDYS